MADVLYMSVKEYAERVAAKASTIRDMCRRAKLPAVKIGTAYRINVKRADAMLEAQIDQRVAAFAPKVTPKVCIRGKSAGGNYLAQLREMRERVI